jgi:hypothetical protein
MKKRLRVNLSSLKRIYSGLAVFHGIVRLPEEVKGYANRFLSDQHFKEYEEIYATI